MALWGSGVRTPSAPPSFALNPLVGFRAKDGVLRSSVCGAEEDGSSGSELRMAGHSLQMRDMFYAYILQSVSSQDQLYRGHSSDLKQRLADHNSGHCPHTAKFIPWKVMFYAAFETLDKAQHFERYLKSGSGHVFAQR